MPGPEDYYYNLKKNQQNKETGTQVTWLALSHTAAKWRGEEAKPKTEVLTTTQKPFPNHRNGLVLRVIKITLSLLSLTQLHTGFFLTRGPWAPSYKIYFGKPWNCEFSLPLWDVKVLPHLHSFAIGDILLKSFHQETVSSCLPVSMGEKEPNLRQVPGNKHWWPSRLIELLSPQCSSSSSFL